MDHAACARILSAAGFIAADEEARELVARAGDDVALLDAMLARRLTGEPLQWITGTTTFCGIQLRVDEGVYVPRVQTEVLARRAGQRLQPHGTAIDVCTGTGAVARVLMAAHPGARVIGTDIDERAVACARANGVEAYLGDLFTPVPAALQHAADVVTGVVPYVPTAELPLLQRDTFTFESTLAYAGGRDGTDLLVRVVAGAPRFLRPGGAILIEMGGRQAEQLRDVFDQHSYRDLREIIDEDGDLRGVEATLVATT